MSITDEYIKLVKSINKEGEHSTYISIFIELVEKIEALETRILELESAKSG